MNFLSTSLTNIILLMINFNVILIIYLDDLFLQIKSIIFSIFCSWSLMSLEKMEAQKE